VLDDIEGPGVESGEHDLINRGLEGGEGVIENDRSMAGMWIVGRVTCRLLEEAVGCCATKLVLAV